MFTILCNIYGFPPTAANYYCLICTHIMAYNGIGGDFVPKKIILRMLRMCPAAWYIFRRGMQLCVILLFGCVVILANNELFPDFHSAYKLYSAMNETAQSVLLVSVLFSVLIEDVSASR